MQQLLLKLLLLLLLLLQTLTLARLHELLHISNSGACNHLKEVGLTCKHSIPRQNRQTAALAA
jgi:hypothetical protein